MDRTFASYDNLPGDTLINRSDIAALANTTLGTVRFWAATVDTFPKGTPRPYERPHWYRLDVVQKWLCDTNRVACDHPGLLSAMDVCARLGIKRQTLKVWVWHDKFPRPTDRIGRSVYWKTETLTEWLAENPRPTPKAEAVA